MRNKYQDYKPFTSENEVKKFLKEYYQDFLYSISAHEKNILSLAHGTTILDTINDYDEFLEVFTSLSKNIPPTPFGLILFRGDDSNEYQSKNRPFLSHSFLESSAKRFTKKNNIYKLYVPEGSRIFPICGINIDGAFCEQEVLIPKKNLRKIANDSYKFKNTKRG